MAPQRVKPSICEERQRLTDAIHQAIQEVLTIHNEEIAALTKGKRLQRSDIALNRALRKREDAKMVHQRHLEKHRCD